MKTVFFSWITNNWINTYVDFNGFVNSFKKFHPDIDLRIFENDTINYLFKKKPWLNYDNCKASFAKLLYNDYDLVVNVDADFYFFDRCQEILDADYDLAACANFNSLLNVHLDEQFLQNYKLPYVSDINYLQGGLIASTNKKFWDEYEEMSEALSNKLPLRENDVLNALWYSGKYKTKVLDGDVDYRSPNFKQYYNCSSLGRLNDCYIKNDKIYLDGKPMRSYHVAWGHGIKARMPQLFSKEICEWFNKKIYEQN
jgi:hypothetical protein